MNYLGSIDYFEAKVQLRDEYKEAFTAIEGYYIRVYTPEKYEVQYSLKQILKDFLSAQDAGKPLNTVVGPDVRDYAIGIIEAELKPKKIFQYWLTNIVFFVWTILMLMFAHVFLSDAYKEHTFIERMRNMYFYMYYVIDLLLLVICYFILTNLRKRISRKLFYRLGLIKLLHIAFVLSILVLAACYLKLTDHYGNELRLHMSLSLYLILFIITTAYLLVAVFISYRETRAKELALVTHEEDSIQQVICPSCGHVHDIDYPKCPSCGLLSTHR